MAKFNGVVALTQAEYNSLKDTGTLTIGTTTLVFDEYTLYLITDSPEVYSKSQVDALLAGGGDISALEERVTTLENTVSSMQSTINTLQGTITSLQNDKANTSDLPTMTDISQSSPSQDAIQYNTLPNGSDEVVYTTQGNMQINTLPNGSEEYILGGNN